MLAAAVSPYFAPPTALVSVFNSEVQMNLVKDKADRSHAFPRELWPIFALLLTGPVLLVSVLLGGDRALQRAWIIALIGLACFGLLGRHGKR
jgi:hypothetical protein